MSLALPALGMEMMAECVRSGYVWMTGAPTGIAGHLGLQRTLDIRSTLCYVSLLCGMSYGACA
jgi:hypothetical protein